MSELDHNPVSVGARGRCPRCASGRLFEGYLTPARECEACGLDFRFIDAGDGPAVFVILVVGFLVVGLALWVEVVHAPSLWFHFLVWPPLAVLVSLPLLRAIKGALIGEQFRRSAAEGRVAMRGPPAPPPAPPPGPHPASGDRGEGEATDRANDRPDDRGASGSSRDESDPVA